LVTRNAGRNFEILVFVFRLEVVAAGASIVALRDIRTKVAAVAKVHTALRTPNKIFRNICEHVTHLTTYSEVALRQELAQQSLFVLWI
jgi:hypothetical protein